MRWFGPILLVLSACSERGVVRTFRATSDTIDPTSADTDVDTDTSPPVTGGDTDAGTDDTDAIDLPVWPDPVEGYAPTVACYPPTAPGAAYRWRVTAIVPEVPRAHAPHGIDLISVGDVWFITPEGCWAPTSGLGFDGDIPNAGDRFTFTAYSSTVSCDLAPHVSADFTWTIRPVGEDAFHVYAETAELDPAGLCRG